MSIKVLVFGMTDNPGGMESCVMNYYRNIDWSDVQFDFLCNWENMVYADEVTAKGSKIYTIPQKSKDYKAYKKALDDFFKAHKGEYDVFWYNTCTLTNIDYLVYAKKYGIKKTVSVCAGGRERYESVWKALQTLKSLESEQEQKTDYVLIHDGARPFLNQEMLERLCACVKEEKACVLGMPVKDTIKFTDENGKIRESPRRDLVWQAQTPQAFAAELLFPAFEKLMQHSTEGITDDAMVVEQEMGIASVMVKGGYENIKITTPEDLLVAESFLAEK